MRTVILALLLLVSSVCSVLAQGRTIRGDVTEEGTNEPLSFVTIRLLGSKKGAISTKEGKFVLRLQDANDTIRLQATAVGFDTTTIDVPKWDSLVQIVMKRREIRSRTFVVTAEDPAMRIMKKVLEKKRAQDTLQRYTYLLYTKFVAITDTLTASRANNNTDSTVFSILESYSRGFVVRPDRYFNQIIQRRQTANIPPQANFVSFGTNLNIYDNSVQILGEDILSPFADDALDAYDYVLTNDEDSEILAIEVKPKSAFRKAFVGTIYIASNAYTPVETKLTPSKAVNLPFDATLSYRQTFMHVGGGVTMPEALSIQASLRADVLFLISPRLDVSIETFCSDYELSPVFDDDIFDQRRVEIAAGADDFDSTFWRENIRVPLKKEEAAAYEEIRIALENPDSLASASFIDRFLGPIPRITAQLGRRPFTGFEDVVRYNRIHGLYIGSGLRLRPDTTVELYGSMGYGIANDRLYGTFQASWFSGKYQHWRIDLSAYDRLQRRDDPNVVRTPTITATTLLFGNDYGDYYNARGLRAGIGYGWGQLRFIRNEVYERPNQIDLWVATENHQSVLSQDVFTLFRRDETFRMNPVIDDGTFRMIGGRIHLNYHPLRTVSRTGLGIDWEWSDPRVLPSTARYFWIHGVALLRTRTLPLWTLDVGLRGGFTTGNVPRQRFFSPESSVNGLATSNAFRGMRVKEFYGDQYAAISFSHNFGEVVPGLFRIPNLASLGLEFLLTGSAAWTSFERSLVDLPSTTKTDDRWYYEAGIAVNRILLFLRLDITARLSQRSLPAFYVTLGSATF
jgi:hypothetical protein